MEDFRTVQQIAANKLDMDLARIYGRLEIYGGDFLEEKELLSTLRSISSISTIVRRGMHPTEREITQW